MMSNNKILTVSYGTFSCTLEGFEDSFGTMKAIAEYFRDLAQDDRYFGAEPPQPDAEMLARIAEKEIARRVEGRNLDGKVVLRAAALASTENAMPQPVTPEQDAAEARPEAEAPETETLVAEAPETDAEDMAAEIAAEAALDALPPQDVAEEVSTEALVAGAVAGAAAIGAAAAAAAEPQTQNEDAAQDDDAAADDLDALGEVAEADEIEAEDDAVSEGIAAALSAAEAQDEDDAAAWAEAEAAEDEIADDEAEADEDPLAAIAAELDTEMAVAQEADDADETTSDDDALAAVAANLDADLDAEDDTTAEQDSETADADGRFDPVDAFDFTDSKLDAAFGANDKEMGAPAIDTPSPLPVSSAGMVGNIAAKLQRIRDVVSRNQAADAAAYSEDEHAEDMAETAQEPMASEADESENDLVAQFDDPALDAALDLAPFENDAEGDEAEQDSAEADEPETAEMEAANWEAQADDDLSDAAMAGDADDQDDITSAFAEIDDELAIDEALDAAEETDDKAFVETPEAEVQAEVEAPVEAAFETGETEMDSEADAEVSAEEPLETAEDETEAEAEMDAEAEPARQGPRARVIKVRRSDLAAAIDDGMLEEVASEETQDESVAESDSTDLDDADLDLSGYEDAEADFAEDDSAETTLSAEDEADLMRELAEVEAEISGALVTDATEAEDETFAPQAAAEDAVEEETETAEADDTAENDLTDLQNIAAAMAFDADISRAEQKADKRRQAVEAGVEDAALDRLMAEADTQMEEPESSSRRAAFNQLRAAVVATREDDGLNAEATAESDDDAYRTDLAQAVKPRRPQVDRREGGEDRRGSGSRPAPLKLVAEQRVDTPDAQTGPVRPRRVAADKAAAEAEQSGPVASFADYAESRGAQALPDLLEAAASYLSFVEGREQFSRPQLMTKVRQVGPKDFTREDGLRSFGQLLRAGKIEKIKGGRFTVSEEIGFQPDDRKAG